MAKNEFPPIRYRIAGHEGYKTRQEVINHLNKKRGKKDSKRQNFNNKAT